MGDNFYSLLSITAILYSLIIDTLMILWSLVTLSAPLFCCMTQMYVPFSPSWTGLMCRLPLESWMNLPRSTSIPPCLLHVICGLGVPSELQWIIPRVPAITFCRDLVLSVNLAVERKEITWPYSTRGRELRLQLLRFQKDKNFSPMRCRNNVR